MENHIYQNLLSILNQSFQDFEIIIFNDNSTDNTESIIKRIQLEDDRIKLISHSYKLGFYHYRFESILNSKGKFVLLMEPNDMYLNGNLFKELYEYNRKNNLDLIEFCVFQQIEDKNKIFISYNDFETHNHNFGKNIIEQPELSNILFYLPDTKEYTNIICRILFNKMIKREILIRSYIYLDNRYYNRYRYINQYNDIIMNVVLYQFAKNFSNINVPGYLNIKRKLITSRSNNKYNKKQIILMNYIYFIKIFYKFIKYFNKDINFLYYEMKHLNYYFLKIKDYNMTNLIEMQVDLIKQILKNENISNDFNDYLRNILLYYHF
jgi:glycosyltransferase involved in cell wall biosynthesis